jgi:hypothetical protein
MLAPTRPKPAISIAQLFGSGTELIDQLNRLCALTAWSSPPAACRSA